MADFNKAFEKVLKHEGGYVNDPDDRGGETFAGIARNFHKSSIIWNEADRLKKENKTKSQINKLLFANEEVMKDVKNIYKRLFWDSIRLDEVYNDKIAYQIFDEAVNKGVRRGVKLAQFTVGLPQTGLVTKELIDKLNLK